MKVTQKISEIMVGVAQLVEPRVVIPVVVGSSPIVHPKSAHIAIIALCAIADLSLVRQQ